MSDIENSYNTDLAGLYASATKHGATVFTGEATLEQIVNVITDYGHLPTFMNRVRKDFAHNTTIIQTPDKQINHTMDKLVNLWTLQQSILNGNDFEDFIVIHHNIKDGRIVFDVHPGRTRLYFSNVYHKPVPVLFLDYSNILPGGGVFKLDPLTEQKCNNFKPHEYRLVDYFGLPSDSSPEYLLVQPNKNEQWHWPCLEQSLEFKLKYTNELVTGILANNKPFIEYKDWVWKINTSII